jgi:hypothetical protein
MASLKTAKPASASHAEPVSKSEQLGGELDLTNNPTPAELQAPCQVDARPAPWRDDDRAYFRANNVTTRIRLPFPDEFRAVLEPGHDAYVHIIIVEREADGQPRRARRRLCLCRSGAA